MAVIIYIAVVLGIDALAAIGARWPFPWTLFNWRIANLAILAHSAGIMEASPGAIIKSPIAYFDCYKFLFWFLIPFLCSIPRMDWGALGICRWKKNDLFFLAAMALICMGAVLLIPLIPSLSEIYRGMSHLPPDRKARWLTGQMIWITAWLPGWEFLHRYVLLRAVCPDWRTPCNPKKERVPGFLEGIRHPTRFLRDRTSGQWQPLRLAWLIVPLSEFLYHLYKPGIEAIGMAAFSVLLTWWALQRRNILLPFLVHLIIEIELVLFLLFL
jgi:hypothetical protein